MTKGYVYNPRESSSLINLTKGQVFHFIFSALSQQRKIKQPGDKEKEPLDGQTSGWLAIE